MEIGVIGMGKLGYCLAAILAQKHKVIGIDIVEPNIPDEPYLVELLETADLEITKDYSRLENCSAIFCVVQTPSKKDGKFTDKYVRDSIKKARDYMGKCDVFNLVSTVMPGTCKKLQRLTKVPITYNPEFIAQGDIVKGMVKPDLVLLGADNPKAAQLIRQIYYGITEAPIHQMSVISAELMKIALNSYVTMKISFANTLWRVAEKIGADIDSITTALGDDKRIGKKYIRAGSTFSGPCFPRDNRAFSKITKLKSYALLTDKLNKEHLRWMYKKIKDYKRISIMGTSFKNGTKMTIESAGMYLARRLHKEGKKVFVDKVGTKSFVVFMLPYEERLKKTYEYVKKHMEYIDFWRDK